jgi:pilus assembly protein TadC
MPTAWHPVVTTLLIGLLAADVTSEWTRPPVRRPLAPTANEAAPRQRSRPHENSEPITLSQSSAVIAGVTVAVLAYITFLSSIVGFAASGMCAMWLAHHRRTRLRHLSARRQAALPELVDALVALIRSGLTPSLAWRELPTCAPPALDHLVSQVIASLDLGMSFADALGGAIDELGPASRRLFDALVTAERYGAPLVPALDRLAIDAASERRRLVETRARQLPVRMSLPLVLCTLPAFVLLGIVPVLIATLSSLTRP